MSSVWEIVVRLFSRRAIDDRTKESVIRKLTIDKNQVQAAGSETKSHTRRMKKDQEEYYTLLVSLF